ncbi:DUF2971 domain-containing protein [Rhizobium leguminosarum]|uniref:DUF2971 domain-containing protein n=1 Tax=Rhizobium leguminosarum TaxID=384 RepID=UPI00102FE003|nr:DUF2971 domain-containing protein [Rhizobium leguminosarum]TAV44983.1 DUF2971 domain-containing protein [Rhizobium leguminosarum]
MLQDRIFKPVADTLVYHYCSGQTLQAILSSKTIRLSDVNMMNDFNEGAYGYGLFEEAASEIMGDDKIRSVFPDLDRSFFEKVDEIISPIQFAIHPVIACFSKKPDVLSQWSRYADEARGFCVGFDAQMMSDLPVTIVEVEYDRATQIKEVREALCGLYMYNREEKLNFGKPFFRECGIFATMLFSFKSESFREEQEVRILHLLNVVADDDRPRLKDAGGVSAKRNVKGQPVKYRVSGAGEIIAYVDLPFPVKKDRSMVREIWYGPRNDNRPGNLLYMASEYGHKNYKMHKSKITLR